jgi:hypothetical protein
MRKTIAAVAVALAVLTGCSSGSDTSDSKPVAAPSTSAAAPESPSATPQQSDVKITSARFEDHEVWGPNAYVVHYTVTNTGNDAADYFAQFEFLDKDGDYLGSTGITADKLGPGKSKKGDSAPLDAEIENGKIADIAEVRVSQVERTEPLS